jgi:hypothetical protein
MNQNTKDVISSSMFFLTLFFLQKKYLIIWLSFIHYIITIEHKPYDINPFIYLLKHVLSDVDIYLSKEKKTWTLKNSHLNYF